MCQYRYIQQVPVRQFLNSMLLYYFIMTWLITQVSRKISLTKHRTNDGTSNVVLHGRMFEFKLVNKLFNMDPDPTFYFYRLGTKIFKLLPGMCLLTFKFLFRIRQNQYMDPTRSGSRIKSYQKYMNPCFSLSVCQPTY